MMLFTTLSREVNKNGVTKYYRLITLSDKSLYAVFSIVYIHPLDLEDHWNIYDFMSNISIRKLHPSIYIIFILLKAEPPILGS